MKTWDRHPALVDVQQRLNCALSSISSSLGFFRYQGLNGMGADFSASLAVDLCPALYK